MGGGFASSSSVRTREIIIWFMALLIVVVFSLRGGEGLDSSRLRSGLGGGVASSSSVRTKGVIIHTLIALLILQLFLTWW